MSALLLKDGNGAAVLHIFFGGRCIFTAAGRPQTLRETYGDKHEIVEFGVCQKCGCTDNDCHHCIERTGEPCSWANEEHTLCSACSACWFVVTDGDGSPGGKATV